MMNTKCFDGLFILKIFDMGINYIEDFHQLKNTIGE